MSKSDKSERVQLRPNKRQMALIHWKQHVIEKSGSYFKQLLQVRHVPGKQNNGAIVASKWLEDITQLYHLHDIYLVKKVQIRT